MRMRILLFPLLLAGLVPSSVTAGADQFVGRASVIDGDTIEIAGQRIRLNGIDAPESWQACRDAAGRPYRCGKDAALALDEFLSKSRPIRCVGHGKDRYRRLVADCWVWSGAFEIPCEARAARLKRRAAC
ncbi:thermonuclease family protein [Rhizobium ruizarguesonis]